MLGPTCPIQGWSLWWGGAHIPSLRIYCTLFGAASPGMRQGRFLWTWPSLEFQTLARVGMKNWPTSMESVWNGAETTAFALLRWNNLVTWCYVFFVCCVRIVWMCISCSHVAGSWPMLRKAWWSWALMRRLMIIRLDPARDIAIACCPLSQLLVVHLHMWSPLFGTSIIATS